MCHKKKWKYYYKAWFWQHLPLLFGLSTTSISDEGIVDTIPMRKRCWLIPPFHLLTVYLEWTQRPLSVGVGCHRFALVFILFFRVLLLVTKVLLLRGGVCLSTERRWRKFRKGVLSGRRCEVTVEISYMHCGARWGRAM